MYQNHWTLVLLVVCVGICLCPGIVLGNSTASPATMFVRIKHPPTAARVYVKRYTLGLKPEDILRHPDNDNADERIVLRCLRRCHSGVECGTVHVFVNKNTTNCVTF